MSTAAPIAPVYRSPSPAGREPTWPDPPRFWWLKRLTVAGVLVVAALAAVRVAWGWEAERRMRRAIAPALARGEPMLRAELNPRPVGDPVNGAAYLKRAAAAVSQAAPSPMSTSLTFATPYPPDSPNWSAVAAQSVAANGAVFPLARQARAHDEFDWGTRVMSPAVATLLPHLNGVRMLAETLADSALYAHETGDDVAALETIRDVRHAAKATRSQPFAVSGLVATGIENLACLRLLEMAPGLRIAAPDAATGPAAGSAVPTPAFPATRPAGGPRAISPAHVRTVINELLDDDDAGAVRRGLAGDRVIQQDFAEWIGGRFSVLRPMFRLDAARVLGATEVLAEAASKADLPAAKGVLAAKAGRLPAARAPGASLFWPGPRTPGGKREAIDFSRLVSNEMSAGVGVTRLVVQNLRSVNERRMTAVCLAAQLYRADHGRWPPSMEALVPAYLPEVPVDVLAPDSARLRYLLVAGGLPGGGDRPVVYSAGGNGVYDTSDPTVLPSGPVYGWLGGADEWRDLARWTPAGPATSPSPGTSPASP